MDIENQPLQPRQRPGAPLPRAADTREAAAAPKAWVAPGALPSPTPRPGVRYKWTRISTRGESDKTNMHRALTSGWTMVAPEDVPELAYLVNTAARGTGYEINTSGNVEFGGLVLMQISEVGAQTRDAYYRNMHRSQEENIDNMLMQNNDPRMPLHNNRKSEVSFGRKSSKSAG